MSGRVAQLESLLARVKERAALPRPVPTLEAGSVEESPTETADELVELDEPTTGFDAPDDGMELDEPLANQSLSEPPASMEVIDELDDMDDVVMEEFDDTDIDVEPQPESGPVSAGTMDDAMEAAAHQPPLTPPPESGEEVATPHIPPRDGPTMEQLGQTISLDEGQDQNLELDEPTFAESAEEPDHQMEQHLPQSAYAQNDELRVPENAREELDRIRLGDSTPIEARVSSRPVLSTNVVEFVSASRSFEPKSFLELVDASLELE